MIALLRSARKSMRAVCAALGMVALAACEPSALGGLGGGGGPSVDPDKPVQVALLLPQSGVDAQVSGVVSRDLERAARLALANLQGARIDLRVYDSGGATGPASAAAQRAVDEGAKIIIGPLFSEAAIGAADAVKDDGVNVLAFSNQTRFAGGNLFLLGDTFENKADRLLTYARGQGRTRPVVVYEDTPAGAAGLAAVQSAAARRGMTVAAAVGFPFSQEGAVGAGPRLKNALQSSGGDSIIMTSEPAGALGLLLQTFPEAGISPAATQYMGLARWDVPADTLRLPGAEGGWFTLPNRASQASFEARYEAAYGAKPHVLAGLAFDGIAAVGALLAQGRKDALSASGLTQASGFQGASGVFRLMSDGTNQRGLAIATVRNGQVVILDPAPTRFGGL